MAKFGESKKYLFFGGKAIAKYQKIILKQKNQK